MRTIFVVRTSVAHRQSVSTIARYTLLALGILVLGGVLLVYVAFIRPPTHSLAQFLQQGREASIKTVVVLAGASMTHASLSGDYVGMVRARFAEQGYEFVNAGRNGSTSHDLTTRIDDIIACQPDVVTILIGTNDVRAHTAADTNLAAFRANLESIVTQLHDRTTARVALLSLPPLGEDLDSDINAVVVQYNRVIEEVADAHGATYLPVFEHLAPLIQSSEVQHHSPYQTRPHLLLGAAVRHYVGGQSWDEIAAAHGFIVLTDQIHLSDRAAGVVAELIAAWLGDGVA